MVVLGRFCNIGWEYAQGKVEILKIL
jgi:hypothetical protein